MMFQLKETYTNSLGTFLLFIPIMIEYRYITSVLVKCSSNKPYKSANVPIPVGCMKATAIY